ncbi:Holliday junction branch migration protein RuvA [Thiorhodovibrio frisius]|uniref:Holliday junction branch migration complex subunit RuvA n=1 Tax=Thiorhodovibrio frisius TaxID=631362 RepID=H8YZ39_9GAMM|nr:Holliday junction branch migration protein RuvA [Thiorhodovibrio frisius]EIC21966.1 Holliday junction DNA helicase, RuvA subunit [Thiorhodovibrio frisius]WPL24255.1 Holliday junction ATP-dependent DNA helicase RuvA [Thiorhodovibrio frisius]
MIGRIQGRLIAKQPPQLMVDVQGIGYELEAPMSVFYDLPELGSIVTLLTHLIVREDAHVLYAFGNEGERALFRHLLKISGVGAKMALAILSSMDAARFAECVQYEDITALCRVPGVGKKTAQRLVIEMKDRLAAGLPATGTSGAATTGQTRPLAAAASPLTEAVHALEALGYRPADAARMARAASEQAETTEEIIRIALKSLNRG